MASNEIGRRIARGDAETAMRIAVAGEAERAREQAVGSVAQVAEGGAVSGDPSWEGKLAALETALISAGVPVDAAKAQIEQMRQQVTPLYPNAMLYQAQRVKLDTPYTGQAGEAVHVQHFYLINGVRLTVEDAEKLFSSKPLIGFLQPQTNGVSQPKRPSASSQSPQIQIGGVYYYPPENLMCTALEQSPDKQRTKVFFDPKLNPSVFVHLSEDSQKQVVRTAALRSPEDKAMFQKVHEEVEAAETDVDVDEGVLSRS